MKVTLDTEARTLQVDDERGQRNPGLYSPEGFEALARVWVKVGWGLRYSYRFSWLGRPIIQLPEDVIRIQEVIFAVQPDVIVETGVAHGGSLVLYASLLEAMGRGRVIGVDIEIRRPNREAIESHPLAKRIALIEGSSTAPDIVADVRSRIGPTDRVLVILDSNHTRAHVHAELEAYSGLVSLGSYIVATDGIMGDLHDVPGGHAVWRTDNPTAAAIAFAKEHAEFELTSPARPFDQSGVTGEVTYWPSAYLKRVR